MNFLKWTLIFTVAFVFAWVLIFTFTQQPFYQQVPAKIFSYETPPVPMYAYVSGAFGVGLFLGLIIAIYYFITKQAELYKRNKKIRSLENELVEIKASLKQNENSLQENSEQKQPEKLLPESDGGIE